MHLLPDDVFMQNIISLGGTPLQLLESKALLKLYMTILRSDYRIKGLLHKFIVQQPFKLIPHRTEHMSDLKPMRLWRFFVLSSFS